MSKRFTDHKEASKLEYEARNISRFCLCERPKERLKEEYDNLKKETQSIKWILEDIQETSQQNFLGTHAQLCNVTKRSYAHLIRIRDLKNQSEELHTKLDQTQAEKAAETIPAPKQRYWPKQ